MDLTLVEHPLPSILVFFVSLLMTFQNSRLAKHLGANFAGKRFFTGVSSHMNVQSTRSCKLPGANFAGKRFFTCVNWVMELQLSRRRETFGTNLTVGWAFPSVNSEMDLQLSRRRELFWTNLTVVRAFPSVNSEMTLQLSRRREIFGANFTVVCSKRWELLWTHETFVLFLIKAWPLLLPMTFWILFRKTKKTHGFEGRFSFTLSQMGFHVVDESSSTFNKSLQCGRSSTSICELAAQLAIHLFTKENWSYLKAIKKPTHTYRIHYGQMSKVHKKTTIWQT